MSVFGKIDYPDLRKLMRAISEAIDESIHEGNDEPAKVAQLTYRIPKYINGLSINSNGYKLSSGGVFIHQKPYVTFPAIKYKKHVELGDLLLISTVIDGSKTTRKALLLQAKMFDELPITPDNPDQHFLYNEWPEFHYIAKALNKAGRKVAGFDLHSSAKYLLLSEHGCFFDCLDFFERYFIDSKHSCCTITAHPTEPLSHHICFAEELLQFVLGDKGKEFQDGRTLPATEIGWSRVIDDLLENTSKSAKSHMKNASQGHNPTRGCGVFGNRLSFLTDYVEPDFRLEPNDNELPPTDLPPRPENNDEDGGGISVIEFVLRREESQETRS